MGDSITIRKLLHILWKIRRTVVVVDGGVSNPERKGGKSFS